MIGIDEELAGLGSAGIVLTGVTLECAMLADPELAGGVLTGLELAGVLADLELAGAEVKEFGSDKAEEALLIDDIVEFELSEKIVDLEELGDPAELSLRIMGKLVIGIFSFSAHPVIKATPASRKTASRILSFFIQSTPA